jgi:nitroreductase
MENLQNQDIIKAIHRSQHCQRNWDLSQEIPDSDLDVLVEAVTQCPSKQNKTFYKVHVIKNRAIIENIHRCTRGFGAYPDSQGNLVPQTNPQVLANVLLAFESYVPEPVPQHPCDEYHFDTESVTDRDQHMAIGLAAGYANIVASIMGYSTGCCACFDVEKVNNLLDSENQIVLLMGIGIKDENRNRRSHHKIPGFVFPTIKKSEIPVIYQN